MKKVVLALLLVVVSLLLGAAPSRVGAAGLTPHPAGLVPRTSTSFLPLLAVGAPTPRGDYSCGDLSCSGYESTINQYFTDVAAAATAHATDNVYSVATQYYDTIGGGEHPVTYGSSFGGSYVDTNQYPVSGCNDGANSVCLTNAQLQTEIESDINAKGWPTGTSNLFFIFTPSNVGICIEPGSVGGGDQCGTNAFCAYHDYITGGNGVVYAVEPTELSGCNATDQGQGFPNDPYADTTISTISHEQNEAITDPDTLDGWCGTAGQVCEIGDLCAYSYGASLGSAGNGQPYNQVINGDKYSVQQEYSNSDGGCVQRLGGTVTPPNPGLGDESGPLAYFNGPVMRTNTVYAIYWVPVPPTTPTNSAPPVVWGTAAVGKTLTTSAGSWNGSPATYAYQWQQCSATGTGCTNISGAVSSLYTLTAGDAGHEVRAEVSAHNSGGWSSATPSAATEVVVPVPAATNVPAVSGVAAVGQTLSTTTGSWNTPASYTYQWLRCSGASCSSIAGATSSTYVLGSADQGDSVEARVFATNAAATTTATSAPTASVVGLPVATKLPHISGRPKVGKKLSAGTGTWSGPPTTYSYQWFRCSAKGKACVHIPRATKSTYKLTKKDAKHRLRVRVTGFNVAGSHPAFSATTRVVPAVEKPAKKHR